MSKVIENLKPEDVTLSYGYCAYGTSQRLALKKASEMGCTSLLEIQSVKRKNGLWCVEFTKEIVAF